MTRWFVLLITGLICGIWGQDLGFVQFTQTWHSDVLRHELLPIQTADAVNECANYCTIRTNMFRESECGGFFVDQNICHLVAKAAALNVSNHDTLSYYGKSLSLIHG